MLSRVMAKNVGDVFWDTVYIPASDQNSDIAVGFRDTDFLKESTNLAIRRRLQAVTLTFDRLTLDVCSIHRMSRDQTLSKI